MAKKKWRKRNGGKRTARTRYAYLIVDDGAERVPSTLASFAETGLPVVTAPWE